MNETKMQDQTAEVPEGFPEDFINNVAEQLEAAVQKSLEFIEAPEVVKQAVRQVAYIRMLAAMKPAYWNTKTSSLEYEQSDAIRCAAWLTRALGELDQA